MITNVLPNEATHSSLDLFERPSLLVAFDGAFEQRIGPVYSPNGPTLEFKVLGDRNNFLDLHHIYLELSCSIHQHNGNDLRYDAGHGVNDSDEPKFVNNIFIVYFLNVMFMQTELKFLQQMACMDIKAIWKLKCHMERTRKTHG